MSESLDTLARMLPHVDLPRFPPALKQRLQVLLEGEGGATASSAKQRGRKRANTLSTRDVHTELDVLAAEVTGGRKRIYKNRDSTADAPDGSFDMVQERESSLKSIGKVCASYLLPQGYPASVSPECAPTFTWSTFSGVPCTCHGLTRACMPNMSMHASISMRPQAFRVPACSPWLIPGLPPF